MGRGEQGRVGKGVYLGCEVLEDGGEVDGGAGADALGVAALLEEPPDASHRELEPGLDGAGHRLLPLASLPSGHLLFSGELLKMRWRRVDGNGSARCCWRLLRVGGLDRRGWGRLYSGVIFL